MTVASGEMHVSWALVPHVYAALYRLWVITVAMIGVSCVACGSALAEDVSDWPTANLRLDADRFVRLRQINVQNAALLGEVCRVRVESGGALQSALIVVDGLLYLTTRSSTMAIDPTDCSVAWKTVYTPEGPEPLPVVRGPAVADGRVYRGTTDCRLLALDAKKGTELWKVNPCDPARGESLAAAPLAWAGVVFIGIAGGDFGVRGKIFAFDAASGREIWHFNTIPATGEFGADTWAGSSARTGGGGTWSTLTLDPSSGELFVPVGNPGADFDAAPRGGKNLFTNSMVVLDAPTGHLKWWYQLASPDDKDYDLGAAPMLFALPDGTQAVALGSKDGYLSVIDRNTHKLKYRLAVTTTLNQHRPVTTDYMRVCPSVVGGVEWNGPSLDPPHRAIVVGAVDWCADVRKDAKPEFKPREMFMGGTFKFVRDPPPSGWITSVDLASGRPRWRFHAPAPVVSGITPTDGGVVFAGDMSGNFYALDSDDGKVLFRYATGGAIAGGVITYQIADAQYVALTSGNVSRLVWGVTGLPSLLIFRLGAQSSASAPTPRPEDARLAVSDVTRGSHVFASNCAACHGTQGEGLTGPALKELGKRLTVAELAAWIMSPVAAADSGGMVMPKLYPSPLKAQDVFDVAAFVGTL